MNSPSIIDTSRSRRQSKASTSTLVVVLTAVASSSLLSGCVAFTTPSAATAYNALHLNHQNKIDVTYPHYGCLSNNKNTNHINCRSQNNILNSRRRGDVSLSMGIRSFIKRKILRKDKGDGEESDGSQEGEDVTLHSILQSPGSAGLMESPLTSTDDTMNKDNDIDGNKKSKRERIKERIKQTTETATTKSSNKYVNDILTKNTNIEQESYEDTQARIKRMKTGGMTEEEKAAFLNNALTRTLPKMKPRGPPIRQEIPGGGDDGKGVKRTKRGTSGSSSGSSAISGNDNLWNALTKKDDTKTKKDSSSSSSSSPGEISVASLMMDGKMKNEDAKRKYMESITNPDRFATFSTYQQTSAISTEEVEGDDEDDDSEAEAVDELNVVDGEVEKEEDNAVEAVEDTAPDTGADFAQMKRQIAEDRELLNPSEKKEQSAAREAVESILSMISSNNDKKKEAAAATTDDEDDADSDDSTNKTKSTDHLAARLGKAAMEQEKRDAEARAAAAKKREEEKQAFAKLQKQREAEAERREMERMEKARKIAEEARRKEEEAAAAQRAELEARQAAQDNYWAEKLKKEQARKQRSQPIDITRKKEVIARDSEERLEREVAKDVERATIREEERAREDPHESEILKEVRPSYS